MKPIKKGQRWKRRDGNKVVVLTTRVQGDYPVLVLFKGYLFSYTKDGHYTQSHEDPYDLIEPWKPKKKAIELFIDESELFKALKEDTSARAWTSSWEDPDFNFKWRKFREVLGDKEGE